jgi:hypothetical protein
MQEPLGKYDTGVASRAGSHTLEDSEMFGEALFSTVRTRGRFTGEKQCVFYLLFGHLRDGEGTTKRLLG